MIYTLPKLEWFQHDCQPFEAVSMACLADITAAFVNVPAAWLGPPRKQLSAEQVEDRTAIIWNIPSSELETLLSKGRGSLWSPVSYLAGTGLKLHAQLSRKGDTGPYSLGVYVHLADITLPGQTLVSGRTTFSCTYDVQRIIPGEGPHTITGGTAALGGAGWANPSVLTASSPSDLEPHLVDGCLKLRFYVQKIM
jgi:hypothetical protein